MKLASQKQSVKHNNSPVCEVVSYPLGDKEIDFAIAKISGRYPAENYVTNETCKEIVYIQEGSGKVTVNGKEYLLNAGDIVLIEAGEKFCWDGSMILYISCRPAWFPEQHKALTFKE